MKVDVSNGEIVDKITILELKQKHIEDPIKLLNVKKELESLMEYYPMIINNSNKKYYIDLYKINSELWEIEDKIRKKEHNKEFDDEFISLARNVYICNDKRAKIKYEINISTLSNLIEEKQYSPYL
jgi:hypothetical protein